jgi:dTDP-4-amino-4,6-dideoxygalactose transaminase
MRISRQKIYRTNFIVSFVKSLNQKIIFQSKQKLVSFFELNNSSKPIFIGRARAGIFLAVKYSLSRNNNKNKICLMSPLTIMDLVNMVSSAGASAEFFDIGGAGLQIDLKKIEARIEEGDISSLIVTHYYGVEDSIEQLKVICDKYNVFLIEDCAISIGSTLNGKYAGSFGHISVFSFSLFKFINYLWGGAIIVNDKDAYHFIESHISAWKVLNFFDYSPQFLKFMKYGIVTFRPIYHLVFHFFRYGLKRKLKFVEKNIQNDPFVAPTNLIDPTCLTRPHDIFFVELASKLGLFYKELQERRVKAYFLYSSLIKYDIHLLDNIEKIKYSSMINYPLKFSSEVVRDQAAIYLLDHGVDASKQIYRNIHQVHGYEALPGSTKSIEALINRLLFIPIHRDVTFTQVMNISQLMKDFFGTYD